MQENIDLWLTDDEVQQVLAVRIKEFRLMRNVSQPKLAEELGVSELTIKKIEQGQGMRLETFIRLVRYFNQLDKLDALFKFDDISIKELYMSKQKPKRKRASKKHD